MSSPAETLSRGATESTAPAGGWWQWLDRAMQWAGHRLNPILKGCGWPTLSTAHIEGLLGENIRRFLNL